MSFDVIALLKVHEYFQGVPDEILQDVLKCAKVAHYPAATVVHEADVVLTTVGFVLRGRLKAVRVSARGTESLFRMINRGEQFGLMVGALSEPVPVRVIALEPTTVLSIDYEQAMELTFLRPELRRLWLKTFAASLRKQFFGAAPKRSPMMLAADPCIAGYATNRCPAPRAAARRR
jgi:NTE family protein